MSQYNDVEFEALRAKGYTGQLNDMRLKYYLDNGATTNCISDAEAEFLIAQGMVAPFDLNDAWYDLLSSLGYAGDFNDMLISFWTDGGNVGAIPDAPQNLVLTVPAENVIRVVFDAVSASPAVTSYTIQYKEVASATYIDVVIGNVLTYDLTGLKAGLYHDVRVFATNSVGDSTPSNVEQENPFGVPEPPALTVVAGIEQAALSWVPHPANTLITDRIIQLREVGSATWQNFIEVPLADTAVTIFDLVGATNYEFQIADINAYGTGPFTPPETATPTAIAAPVIGLFNETGIDTSTNPAFWTNSGSDPSWNATVAANPSKLLVQTTKGRKNPVVGVNTGFKTSNPTSYPQPYSLFFAFKPWSLRTNRAIMVWDRTPLKTCEVNTRTGGGFARFGGSLPTGLALTKTLETYQGMVVDGANSFQELFKNNAVLSGNTNSGNAGSNNFKLDRICYGNTARRSFHGPFYEFRFYGGALSAAEQDAVKGAYKQKWFSGFPYIEV